MKNRHLFWQKTLLVIAIICLIAVVLLTIFVGRKSCLEVRCSSDNGKISVAWNAINLLREGGGGAHVEIKVLREGKVIFAKHNLPIIGRYYFCDGQHGAQYNISVNGYYKDGAPSFKFSKKLFFLDYKRLGNLPLVIICTEFGEDPTYKDAVKPNEELWGATEVDNKYLSASIMIVGNNIKPILQGANIRTRGNTSTVQRMKKSYKIKLDNNRDILGIAHCRTKEWILLNNADTLTTYVGNCVGAIVGMEWQPHMKFVNLILNGDFKGCYALTPAIGIKSSNGLVRNDGYIFECDAYWWKPKTIYFKTEKQIFPLAYTFKYPRITDFLDKRLLSLQQNMQEFENHILSGDPAYRNYIDETSFVRWILARDIMGNRDGGGCNMYFYKQTADSKIKMGPLWDFDSSLTKYDSWSTSRPVAPYFSQLFGQVSFAQNYSSEWKHISQDLIYRVKQKLDELRNEYGVALDESWRLEGIKYGTKIQRTFEKFEKEIEKWLYIRTAFINNSLGFLTNDSNLLSVSRFKTNKKKIRFRIDKTEDFNEYTKLTGWAFVAESPVEVSRYRIGVKVKGKIYFATEFARDDVQDTFNLKGNMVGFTVNIPKNSRGTIVVCDFDQMVIFEE